MTGIARAAYSGENFAPYHVVQTGPLDGEPDTNLDAFF